MRFQTTKNIKNEESHNGISDDILHCEFSESCIVFINRINQVSVCTRLQCPRVSDSFAENNHCCIFSDPGNIQLKGELWKTIIFYYPPFEQFRYGLPAHTLSTGKKRTPKQHTERLQEQRRIATCKYFFILPCWMDALLRRELFSTRPDYERLLDSQQTGKIDYNGAIEKYSEYSE